MIEETLDITTTDGQVVAAVASLYGTWLVNDAEESSHLSLGKVKGEAACLGGRS